MKRKVNAIWKGDGMDGSGSLSSQSGAFENCIYFSFHNYCFLKLKIIYFFYLLPYAINL